MYNVYLFRSNKILSFNFHQIHSFQKIIDIDRDFVFARSNFLREDFSYRYPDCKLNFESDRDKPHY